MKKTLIVMLASAALVLAEPTVWHLDPAHSGATFSVRHMGISTVRGKFAKVTGTVTYDPADLSQTVIDVSIDASSLDTGIDRRDNDVRSDHFLDVKQYPTITFKSKGAEPAGEGKLKVTGDLTIHGVTKQVVLNVDGPSQPITDPMGHKRIGASATTTINRSDFGMTNMQGMVGNEITITIDTELTTGTGQPGPRPGAPGAPPPPGAPPTSK